MTATPIPRSLALAVYGDLDTSVLDERPPGRTPPVTRSYPAARREAALRQVERGVSAGGQAFVVCPAVEDGEERDLRSAVSVFAELSERFRDLGVALVHGRQDFEERQSEMARFVAGEAKVLVSTTVFEVGVDVPRANVILIEDAERFGLAQLHQLRGRVGRGGQRSACLLVTRAREDGDAAARLSVLCRTDDGFEIAEEDLQLRGPGEVFGRRQSGLPGFRFADLRRDRPLLERARALARELVERDPTLGDPAHAAARRAVERLEAARALVGEEAG
jgi:ATP-dependent DNA helicase RecG